MGIGGNVLGQSPIIGRNITVRTTGDESKAGGGGTTLSDVRSFLQNEGGSGKVYGRQNKDGSVTLYVSDKRASLFDRVTGRAATRRNVARQEIGRLLGDMKASHDGKALGTNARNMTNAIFSRITGQVVARENRALRSADVIKLARSAQVISSAIDDVATKPEKASYDIDQALAAAPGDGRALSDRPSKIFTTMYNKPLLAPEISVGGKDYVPVKYLASGGFGHVVAYEAADGSKLAVKLGKDPKSEAGTDIPEFVEETKLALHGEAAAEIVLHGKATGGNAPNLLKLQGAFKTDDGRIGIALDFASNGTVQKAGYAVLDAIAQNPQQVGRGQITRAEADILRMTMVKDMADGLRQLHGNGVTHFDFKGPNCLIDGEGRVKIADFGGSFEGVDSPRSTQIDVNALWAAPELAQADRLREKYAETADNGKPTPFEDLKSASRNEVIGVLKEIFPGQDDANYVGGANEILFNRFDNLDADLSKMARIDNSVDLWGLGTSALDLFSRYRSADGSTSVFDDVKSVAAWAENKNNKALGTRDTNGDLPPGVFDDSTGSTEVDKLINKLLSPDAGDRATFFQHEMSTHPAMTVPGVGSPEARALLASVASGDADAIRAARVNLTAAFQAITPIP